MRSLFMNDKSFEGNQKNKTDNQKAMKEFDQLKLADYAKVLQRFIHDCETPMTIGLQGDWGIGKSTLLNMLRVELPEKHPIVDFNTWQYSLFGQDEYLGLSAVSAMLALIEEKFEKYLPKDENSAWKKASTKVKGVLRTVKVGIGPLSIGSANEIAAAESSGPDYTDISGIMKDLKNDFESMINDILKAAGPNKISKIIFFIDDIDRVKPVKALELLESLKNFFDVNGCVFVLAVDYEVVQIGMAEKLGVDLQKISGKSFFDKIINLPFAMPTQSYSLDKYLENLLKDNGLAIDAMKAKDWKEMSQISNVTIGRNPRSIKRAVNYMKVIGILRSKVSDFLEDGKGMNDLLNIYDIKKEHRSKPMDLKLRWCLVCMQVAWPELYSYFVKNPSVETINNLEDWEFLDSLSEIKKMYDRVNDEEELKNNISDFFDILYSILDFNKDDKISHDELRPLLFVMYYTKMTEVHFLKEDPPFLEFTKNVLANAKRKEPYNIFLNEIFKSSHWFQSRKITYKRSSSGRFISLVYDRKRIGTLVSMSTQPFKFRVGFDDEILVRDMQKNNKPGLPIPMSTSDQEREYLDYDKYIKDYEGRQTGWGETEIDIELFMKDYPIDNQLNQRCLRRLLNQVYHELTRERK